ncbi:MAG TPA: hypothetical protein VIL99_06405 [Ignavibacteria bacterium]
MEQKKGILELTLSKRTDLTKLILAACILALGIGLIANYLTNLFVLDRPLIIIFTGLILVFLVVVFFIYSIIVEADKKIGIEGIIALERKTNDIYPIMRYEFSESLVDTLNAVFLENKALKKYWDEEFKKNESEKIKKNKQKQEKISNIENPESVKNRDIGYFAILSVTDDISNKEKSKSDKILEEVVEYLIIEQLSTHLSTYFNDYDEQDKIIKEYTRHDFPEILLKNRIVNLLSTPFEDRDIFVKTGVAEIPSEGEIIAILGGDGSRFSRFDLKLPKGSIVKRPANGILSVENNRIFLQIEINYGKFVATLPKGFEQNYLGLNHNDLDIRKIDINLRYKIKPIAFFYRSKWNYHNWVDSFAERLIDFFSFETFVEHINWETSLTGIIINNKRRKLFKERELLKKKDSEEKEKAKNENE